MIKKWIPLLAIVAIASLGFVACGDDEEDGGDQTSVTQEAGEAADEAADEAEEAVTGEAMLDVTADPGGALEFEQSELTAKAGEVMLELTNKSPVPHDVVIEDASGKEIGKTDQITNATDETTVELESGAYTFYCSVPGHREAGMEGALTVE